VGSSQVAPAGARIRNPAFDVTPHRYITAIITDRGIFHPPFAKSLREGEELTNEERTTKN
jgi:methylthioribose-1-phosphate isomerase